MVNDPRNIERRRNTDLGFCVEEVVTPFDRRAHPSLPLRKVNSFAREVRPGRIEALEQRLGRRQPYARSGELDGASFERCDAPVDYPYDLIPGLTRAALWHAAIAA